MAIPDRLKLFPPNQDVFDQMSSLCDGIERELESGESAENLLQQWHTYAHRIYDPFEFKTYWKAVSKEKFILGALYPAPAFDAEVLYSESLAVLEVVSTVAVSEAECGYYLGWLDAQFPDGNIGDLIYWPDEWFGERSLFRDPDGTFRSDAELSNDQILAYAMAKSGRKLPDSPSDVVLPFPMPHVK